MRLSPARFNRLLKPPLGLGQKAAWRRAYQCPCRHPHSGAARQGCARCQGRGVFWTDPTPAWTGLASMKVARAWADFGLWESGDVVLTIPGDSPLYQAGEYDRVVMVDSTEPFSALLTDEDLRPTVTGDMTSPTIDDDDLHGDGWQPVTYWLGYAPPRIDRVFWLEPATESIVEGAVPAIIEPGFLTWITPPAPPVGVQFSVSGRRHPEFFIFKDLPQDRAHHGGAALPRRVVARRFDLFGR